MLKPGSHPVFPEIRHHPDGPDARIVAMPDGNQFLLRFHNRPRTYNALDCLHEDPPHPVPYHLFHSHDNDGNFFSCRVKVDLSESTASSPQTDLPTWRVLTYAAYQFATDRLRQILPTPRLPSDEFHFLSIFDPQFPRPTAPIHAFRDQLAPVSEESAIILDNTLRTDDRIPKGYIASLILQDHLLPATLCLDPHAGKTAFSPPQAPASST